ncbi:MAG: GAF domain-containing protein [Pseudanabaenaceae cyanobacterium bins.39]|nr:GAF domain-containing protein [Pseudanabaenaceae cyanobacterium bins.39]
MKDLEALTALQLQTNLLKSSISYVQSVSGSLILRTTLKNILETLIKHTDADDGSIFLIDEDGSISESILARGPVTRDRKDDLINRVLEEGLAGWSLRQQQIGIIHDATKDYRWLQLTDQPYTALSAIALPLFYGLEVIGMITLSHEKAHHFDENVVQLLQQSMEGIAAIVVNAQIHAEYRPLGLI